MPHFCAPMPINSLGCLPAGRGLLPTKHSEHAASVNSPVSESSPSCVIRWLPGEGMPADKWPDTVWAGHEAILRGVCNSLRGMESSLPLGCHMNMA